MQSYRHENKYLLNAKQETELQLRTRMGMTLDPHAAPQGSYLIRSLYLDDPEDGCLQDNLSGVDRRAKFRIRRYTNTPGLVLLERKSKLHGLGRKDTCTLQENECLRLMYGEPMPPDPSMPEEKQRLLAEMLLLRLRPKIIVSYERVPYLFPAGNVRITFDRNLTASDSVTEFLNEGFAERPVFPVGQSLLEVKWDEMLPPHIRMLVQTDGLRRTAFSKYAMCRTHDFN